MERLFGKHALLIGLVLIGVAPARADLVVRGYNAGRHDRFENSSSFVGDAYDWSGVSSGPDSASTLGWATMVTKTHFVSATHFHPGSNRDLTFYHGNDPNGPSETHRVRGGTRIGTTDLWLGELQTAVSDDVAVYEVLAPKFVPRSDVHLMGLASTSDRHRNQRLGRNRVNRVIEDFDGPGTSVGDVITYDYNTVGGAGDDEAWVRGGDSGAPSFFVFSGRPVLMGVHWFLYTGDSMREFGNFAGGSGDTLVSSYIDEINGLLPMGQQLAVATPEPSSMLLLGLPAVGFFAHRRRRRRTTEQPASSTGNG